MGGAASKTHAVAIAFAMRRLGETSEASGETESGGARDESSELRALKMVVVVVLACLSAIFSGLNLGLMCLDENQLVLLINAAERPDADGEAKRHATWARRILPLRKDGNTLLCTVLLGNVMVNSYMAILLDELFTGTAAFIASTFIIVTFGEIIPQSLCYKHGLRIGSLLMPIVRVFWFVLLPVTKPLALLLDWAFGEEIGQVLDRHQLLTLVDYQRKQAPHLLTEQEAKILHGSIGFATASVESVMVPFDDCFCLDANAIVNPSLVGAVADAGFSRIPVIDRDPKNPKLHFAVVGLIHVKDLLLIDMDLNVPLKSLLPLIGRKVCVVDDDQPLPEILDQFRQGASQLAVVRSLVDDEDCDPYFRHVGVISLQDLLNTIVQDDVKEVDGDDLDNLSMDSEVPERMFSNVGKFQEEALPPPVASPSSRVSRSSLKFVEQALLRSQRLSGDETMAAAAFLLRRYPSLFVGVSHEDLEDFLQRDCHVTRGGRPVEVPPPSLVSGTAGNGHAPLKRDQALYRRGEKTDFAALVVDGEVKVFAGREMFESIHGPWSLLGKRSLELNCELEEDEHTPRSEKRMDVPLHTKKGPSYRPDFTAYSGTEGKDGMSGTRLLIIPAGAHRRLLEKTAGHVKKPWRREACMALLARWLFKLF